MAIEIKNGRINGKRITIYDVYYYQQSPYPYSPTEIAEQFQLSSEELQAALDYIEAHRDEVHEVHVQIEARNALGNPPEIEERLKDTRRRMQAWLEERRRSKDQGENGAGNLGGR